MLYVMFMKNVCGLTEGPGTEESMYLSAVAHPDS